jgi:hypothetical protein
MQATQDRRPSYVQQLDLKGRQDEAELNALNARLWDLKCYLTSPKFSENRRVEVADILNWLDQATTYALERRAEVI